MNDIQRKAEFYAKLANIEKLEALSQADKAQLIVDAMRAELVESFFGIATAGSKDKKFMKSWDDAEKIPGAWLPIYAVHPWARKLINSILDTGRVDVREFDEVLTRTKQRPEIWLLNKDTHRVEPQELITGTLFAGLQRVIILADHFLFSRCAECKKVFVPAKNQKYCSKSCATKALAPSKRKYMREYMRERRKYGNR